MTARLDNRLKGAVLAVLATGIVSTQDAIVKSMTGEFPAHEVVLIRGAIGIPILVIWLAMTDGMHTLRTPLFWPIVGRGAVMCAAYFAFILSLAAMPIANCVAIYFTMPFFVAGLAGPFLGEQVPIYRWLAMIAGFMGVLIMVRPGAVGFEPASLLALLSAFGYAVGHMMGRVYAQKVPALGIALIQTVVYLIVAGLLMLLFDGTGLRLTGHKSLEFLSRPSVIPSFNEFGWLAVMGVLGALGSVVFTSAYRNASASFVAPFEYTAMIWAVAFGLLFFSDFPDLYSWLGVAVVISAGLLMMWRDARHRTG